LNYCSREINQLKSMGKIYYVYFLTNYYNTVLYTGSTENIYDRVFEHKEKVNKGFTNKYNCIKLVYFEEFQDLDEAIDRERQLKRYKRKWKENLIQTVNPSWRDLSKDFEIENK
jgi:putative endonuclease